MGAQIKRRAVIEGALDAYTIEALRAVVLEAPRGVSLRVETVPFAPPPPLPAAPPIPVIVLPERNDRSIGELIEQVAYETGVSAARIRGDRRNAPEVRARIAVCWAASELLGRSSTVIGRALGDRDHSTILSARRRADTLLGRDPAFVQLTSKLRNFVAETRQ